MFEKVFLEKNDRFEKKRQNIVEDINGKFYLDLFKCYEKIFFFCPELGNSKSGVEKRLANKIRLFLMLYFSRIRVPLNIFFNLILLCFSLFLCLLFIYFICWPILLGLFRFKLPCFWSNWFIFHSLFHFIFIFISFHFVAFFHFNSISSSKNEPESGREREKVNSIQRLNVLNWMNVTWPSDDKQQPAPKRQTNRPTTTLNPKEPFEEYSICNVKNYVKNSEKNKKIEWKGPPLAVLLENEKCRFLICWNEGPNYLCLSFYGQNNRQQ